MISDHVITADEHELWLERTLARRDRRYFVFELSGVPAGVVGFYDIHERDRRAEWTLYVDPGRVALRLGTAMAFLALEFGFGELKLHKVTCEVIGDNEKSLRLHERLGFKPEGLRKNHVLKNGEWRDVHELAVFADAWTSLDLQLRQSIFSTGTMP
jgi:UDP-4-amino-4,6-dideoxy-N-acetyl-beta-L-altrosamine N-acetyltransferase